ncbi:MAG: hypothetical protein V3S87_15115 [Alphaproteobacteria bacterium]
METILARIEDLTVAARQRVELIERLVRDQLTRAEIDSQDEAQFARLGDRPFLGGDPGEANPPALH